MENSSIEWTNHTFKKPPLDWLHRGKRVMRTVLRTAAHGYPLMAIQAGAEGTRVRTKDAYWRNPV